MEDLMLKILEELPGAEYRFLYLEDGENDWSIPRALTPNRIQALALNEKLKSVEIIKDACTVRITMDS